MRLHRIRLRDYRGVRDAEIRFDPDGVTVIEGDNEVGKTSLLEALRLALDYPDNSKARLIAEIQPKGLDVGPSVELELSTGGYEISFRKRWLRESMTELRVSGRNMEQLSGREAHDRLKQIIAETVDEELWDALRLSQGGRVTPPSFSALATALDRAAAGTESSEQDDSLVTRIEAERLRYWTPTGKMPVERERKSQDVRVASERVAELREQLENVEHTVGSYEEAASLAIAFGEQRLGEERRLLGLDTELARVEKLEREAERCDGVLTQLQSESELRSDRLDNRQQLITQQMTLTTTLSKQSTAADEAEASLEQAKGDFEKAEAALATAREKAAQCDKDHATVETHLRYLELESELHQLRSRHQRYLTAQQTFDDASAIVERSTVDDEMLMRIEDAERALDLANTAVQGASITVETIALEAFELHIGGDSHPLNRDQVHVELVEDELELVVEDLVRIRVSASADARALAVQRDEARAAYEAVTRQAGVTNVVAARNANRQLRNAEVNRREAQIHMQHELDGLSVEQLVGDIAVHSQQVDAHHPDSSLPKNPEQAQALSSARKTESDSAQLLVVKREEIVQSATLARHGAEIAAGAIDTNLRQTAQQLEEVETALRTARSQVPDDILRTELKEAQTATEDAQRASNEARTKLQATNPELLRDQKEEVQTERDRVADRQEYHQQRRDELRGRLDQAGSLGLKTQLDDAEQRYQAAERENARIGQQAKAVALLSSVIAAHRQAARNRHAVPFQQRIEQLGRVVYGAGFSVEIDDTLEVKTRTLEGITLPVEQLSVGAQEQLSVICRLACAALVSPEDGGAPLIMDDALGWSDPKRLKRMGEVFADAAQEQCQVILLTCTPGRYADVPNTTVHTLATDR